MTHVCALGAPLVLTLILALSGVAKLRSPGPARQAFTSLRLPRWLSDWRAPEALPWGELLLAVAILVAPGRFGVVVTALAAILMAIYLALILRALGFDEKVSCGCFGELGLGDVTWRTALRNVLLVGLGAMALWAAVRDERSPVLRWWQAGTIDWAWLGLTAMVVCLTWLIVGGRAQSELEVDHVAEPSSEELEYVRIPTPFASVTTADGETVTIRDLSSRQAQLVLFVNSTCGSCIDVIEKIPAWAESLAPAVAVRPLFAASGAAALGDVGESVNAALPDALFDPSHSLSSLLGIHGTPSAVLFGADLLLAGGPVAGRDAVIQLVEDIQTELRDAQDGEGTDG